MTFRGVSRAMVACAVLCALGSATTAGAQLDPITNLTCQLRSCTDSRAGVCTNVAEFVAISIDLEGARARGGTLTDWAAATIHPDLITFSRNVSDGVGIDRQSYSVSRTNLVMTWQWFDTPTSAPDAAVSVSARYQCRIVHAQF